MVYGVACLLIEKFTSLPLPDRIDHSRPMPPGCGTDLVSVLVYRGPLYHSSGIKDMTDNYVCR